MNLFSKLKNNKWNEAYKGTPHFYKKQDGSILGTFALTENTLSIMPKNPKKQYKVDNNIIEEWTICFISTTKDKMIGEINYYHFLNKITDYIIAKNTHSILINNLSLNDMENILK